MKIVWYHTSQRENPLDLWECVNQRSDHRKVLHRRHVADEQPDRRSFPNPEKSAALPLVMRAEPIHIERIPRCRPLIAEEPGDFLADRIRTAQDNFPAATEALDHHGVPPLQIAIAQIADGLSDRLRLAAVGSVIHMDQFQ